MMIYASKLVADVMAKQEMADMALMGLSVEVQHAIALAEHFQMIVPDEYVLPTDRLGDSESEVPIVEPQYRSGTYSPL